MDNNLTILPRQADVSEFYNLATLVLNLSDKRQFIETFGMTALEAMSAGLPVIVPTEGGIAEMVEGGQNGYKIDVQDLDKINERIRTVLSDEQSYIHLATQAYKYSKQFNEEEMVDRIAGVLNK